MNQLNSIFKLKKSLDSIIDIIKRKGIFHIPQTALSYFYCKLFISQKSFDISGIKYKYFIDHYNGSWQNERAVEIPLVLKFIENFEDMQTLEIGNVLSHYFQFQHDIVDKYEKMHGVINQDIISFSSERKYKRIICISTMEHVGWDENPKDPSKILLAIENIKTLLAPDGKILITLPVGYNTVLDNYINDQKIIFSKTFYLLRLSKHIWKESNWDEIKGSQFGQPFPCANGLIVGIIEKT